MYTLCDAQLTSPVHRRASSASQQRLKTAKDISHPFECFPAKKTKNLCCFCVIFVLLHYEQHLTVSWCLGIFPSVHECAFLFSYSNLSSKWEPQSRCALQQGWFTPMQPMDSSAALHTTHVTQNLVFFPFPDRTEAKPTLTLTIQLTRSFSRNIQAWWFSMAHKLSAVPSVVQLSAHPTCQSQLSRTAGTALTPTSWTSRQNKTRYLQIVLRFLLPVILYYKLLWNIPLGKTLMNRSWYEFKKGTQPTYSWLSAHTTDTSLHSVC